MAGARRHQFEQRYLVRLLDFSFCVSLCGQDELRKWFVVAELADELAQIKSSLLASSPAHDAEGDGDGSDDSEPQTEDDGVGLFPKTRDSPAHRRRQSSPRQAKKSTVARTNTANGNHEPLALELSESDSDQGAPVALHNPSSVYLLRLTRISQ